jgi:hypothetical protein
MTNEQFQMTKEIPTPNSQPEPSAHTALFGYWSLVILWTFVIGHWSFAVHRPLPK